VFWNSFLLYSSTFTSTPVSLPTWNVYQMDCWHFDIWITKQLFRIGSYVSSCCMGRDRVLFRGFLVCFPSYACCVDLLCVLACVEVALLVSGVGVRVRRTYIWLFFILSYTDINSFTCTSVPNSSVGINIVFNQLSITYILQFKSIIFYLQGKLLEAQDTVEFDARFSILKITAR
jgi:hypothetical protein